MQKSAISSLKKVAILGGSFDPPTISHLQVSVHVHSSRFAHTRCHSQVVAEAYNKLSFDEVWLIPCGFRPDKTHISAPQHRLKMT